MFGQKRKDKLSNQEIEEALARLRQGYDDYIIKYMMPPGVKAAFEDRYIAALRSRLDLTRFIRDEMIYLKKLHHEQQEAKKLAQKAEKTIQPLGFADRVMKKMEKKIENYPALEFHNEASMEIKKLYGALLKLDKAHWAALASFIKRGHSSSVSHTMENRLLRMTSPAGRDVPPDLDRYFFLLNKKDVHSSELLQEVQECIKRASFFLHELRQILEEYKDRGLLDEEVKTAYNFIEQMIDDFRLKDLKRL